jgi:hypothetical protein
LLHTELCAFPPLYASAVLLVQVFLGVLCPCRLLSIAFCITSIEFFMTRFTD